MHLFTHLTYWELFNAFSYVFGSCVKIDIWWAFVSLIWPLVPQYMVSQSEVDASKEGRSLTDFKYACIGYSVYPDRKDHPRDVNDGETELPVCVGIEVSISFSASISFSFNCAHLLWFLFEVNSCFPKWFVNNRKGRLLRGEMEWLYWNMTFMLFLRFLYFFEFLQVGGSRIEIFNWKQPPLLVNCMCCTQLSIYKR